jgi:hypothetical protein
MKLADLVTNFFSSLRTDNGLRGDSSNNDSKLPPIHVVRSNDVLPNPNPRLAKIQPKIERDLVKVDDLPLMSEAAYSKVSQEEDLKDRQQSKPNNPSYLDQLKEVLHFEEGGSQQKAYIPMRNGVPIGKSGVTVGKGFDLGQFDVKGLRNLGVSKEVLRKVQPFLNVKGPAAARILKENPLTLSPEDVKHLNEVVFNKKTNDLESLIKNIETRSKKRLSDNQKVALGSMYYQGINPKSFPDTFELMSKGKWDAARKAFLNSKWARQQTPERAKRTIEALFNDVSLREAEDKLSSLGKIDPRRRVFTT